MGRFVQDGTGIVVSVADEKDDRFTSGWTREGEAPAKPAKVAQSETPDDTWSVKNLKAYAGENSIEIGAAKSKADILALIIAPQTAQVAAVDGVDASTPF